MSTPKFVPVELNNNEIDLIVSVLNNRDEETELLKNFISTPETIFFYIIARMAKTGKADTAFIVRVLKSFNKNSGSGFPGMRESFYQKQLPEFKALIKQLENAEGALLEEFDN